MPKLELQLLLKATQNRLQGMKKKGRIFILFFLLIGTSVSTQYSGSQYLNSITRKVSLSYYFNQNDIIKFYVSWSTQTDVDICLQNQYGYRLKCNESSFGNQQRLIYKATYSAFYNLQVIYYSGQLPLLFTYSIKVNEGQCGDNIKDINEECDTFQFGCLNCTVQPGYACIVDQQQYYQQYYSKCTKLDICGDKVKDLNEECDTISSGCINCLVQPGYECFGSFGVQSLCQYKWSGLIGGVSGGIVGILITILIIIKCYKRKKQKQIEEINKTVKEVNPEQIDSNIDCAICLGQKCNSVLYCKHFFHQECISYWLKKNKSCPICRAEPRDMREIQNISEAAIAIN